jgi:hypothetical protein
MFFKCGFYYLGSIFKLHKGFTKGSASISNMSSDVGDLGTPGELSCSGYLNHRPRLFH